MDPNSHAFQVMTHGEGVNIQAQLAVGNLQNPAIQSCFLLFNQQPKKTRRFVGNATWGHGLFWGKRAPGTW